MKRALILLLPWIVACGGGAGDDYAVFGDDPLGGSMTSSSGGQLGSGSGGMPSDAGVVQDTGVVFDGELKLDSGFGSDGSGSGSAIGSDGSGFGSGLGSDGSGSAFGSGT